jgi:hypothetical protein
MQILDNPPGSEWHLYSLFERTTNGHPVSGRYWDSLRFSNEVFRARDVEYSRIDYGDM